MTELVHASARPAGEPEGALVLMHGRGADEHDLAPFLDLLDPKRRLVGVTPGGPLFLPPGGRHWYVVPRVGYPDPDTFRASYELLQRDVPELTGVPWERTILGGFSQGTVMAYALGLGAGRPTPAGIVAHERLHPDGRGLERRPRPAGPAGVDHARPPRPGDRRRVRPARRATRSRRPGPTSPTASTRAPTTSIRARWPSCRRGCERAVEAARPPRRPEPSVVEHRQVQRAQALGVGDRVDLDDPPAAPR